MRADGSCPTCGQVLELKSPAARSQQAGEDRPVPKAPWHFKLLLVSIVVYLGFRAWQGIEWLVGRMG